QASIQLNILQTKLATAKSLYQSFLEKTNQVNIESAEQHNNLRLIDPAIMPTSPVSPNRPRTIAIGFLLSLMLGVGLSVFLESLDNRSRPVEALQRSPQRPALAVIPAISASKSPLLVGGKKKALTMGGAAGQVLANNSRSTIAEAYRVLRTSVLLSNA